MMAIAELKQALAVARSESAEEMIIDLGSMTFIDCSGLRALVVAERAGREGSAPVKFIAGPPNVQRVFEITAVDRRLDWVTETVQ
jgi:anti-anti-sigma factor